MKAPFISLRPYRSQQAMQKEEKKNSGNTLRAKSMPVHHEEHSYLEQYR
jgi:hypothetical protein